MDIYQWLVEEWENGNLIPHIEDDLRTGGGYVECVSCGIEVTEETVHFHELDTTQKYPLCSRCDETADVRLLLIEAGAQLVVDQLIESKV